MLSPALWADAAPVISPSLLSAFPFVILLLCIAVLPLFHGTHHWWERNRNKLLISLALSLVTLVYYLFRELGFFHDDHRYDPGVASLLGVLHLVILREYIPFMAMLFSLYTISGGIRWDIRMKPTPWVNATLLLVGALLASFIGTTGASMLLIRPVLDVNKHRKYKLHTILFFIFLVANIGGALLPLGDPPLFIGYLRGVPFLWTLVLVPHWATCVVVLLLIYFIWDTLAYRREVLPEVDLSFHADGRRRRAFEVNGRINYFWLAGVVFSLAYLVPGKAFVNTNWIVPPFLREAMMLLFTALSWLTTPKGVRAKNQFNFIAIGEVAFLFIGIFICMMPTLEILQARGTELRLTQPWQFFWVTGLLSSFLDNAPTYAIFFEAAISLNPGSTLPTDPLLIAISAGAVFMGANTYIGNGPNFMVKSIAEGSGIVMPSFFGYMLYSVSILIPLFIVLTFLFFR
ncbi:MAG TPA: sodium:proton antiporter [Gemmatales bacterium]|nr:sodium:proton antiporter [Gemmatales bacterium]